MDPLTLRTPRLLNLIHYYLTEQIERWSSDEAVQRHRDLEHRLTGPLTTRQPRQLVEATPTRPAAPSWWTDDDDATELNLQAIHEMQQIENQHTGA